MANRFEDGRHRTKDRPSKTLPIRNWEITMLEQILGVRRQPNLKASMAAILEAAQKLVDSSAGKQPAHLFEIPPSPRIINRHYDVTFQSPASNDELVDATVEATLAAVGTDIFAQPATFGIQLEYELRRLGINGPSWRRVDTPNTIDKPKSGTNRS